MAGHADSLKSVLLALGANFGIACGKAIAAAVTGSGAMLAEAIHSFADSANQGLLLWGMKTAKQEPDEEHPLGYGKSIYFWSFVVALLLFSVGGLFSIDEGWHKLRHPEPITYPWIAIAVLGFSVVLESFSLWGAMREIAKVRGARSWWRWFRETRQSELVVVFGEDIAALMGLAVACAAVLLAVATGDPRFDALGSIAVGVLLIVVAVLLSVQIKAMLVGQSAEKPMRDALAAQLRAEGEVLELLELITLHFGDDLMVAVKARMKDAASSAALSEKINAIEARCKQAFPQVRWIFFEPDVRA